MTRAAFNIGVTIALLVAPWFLPDGVSWWLLGLCMGCLIGADWQKHRPKDQGP